MEYEAAWRERNTEAASLPAILSTLEDRTEGPGRDERAEGGGRAGGERAEGGYDWDSDGDAVFVVAPRTGTWEAGNRSDSIAVVAAAVTSARYTACVVALVYMDVTAVSSTPASLVLCAATSLNGNHGEAVGARAGHTNKADRAPAKERPSATVLQAPLPCIAMEYE